MKNSKLLEQQALAEQFIEGEEWNDIYRIWKHTMDEFGVDTRDFFSNLTIKNPLYNEELAWVTWYFKGKDDELFSKIIVQNKGYPEYPLQIHYLDMDASLIKTLEHLFSIKDDQEKVASVLICASLFIRLFSSNRKFPQELWPPYDAVVKIYEIADDKWGRDVTGRAWLHSCSQLLPIYSNDYDYKISSIRGLIRYLAEEHCKVFLQYTAISIHLSH